jgi:hypothetical protein
MRRLIATRKILIQVKKQRSTGQTWGNGCIRVGVALQAKMGIIGLPSLPINKKIRAQEGLQRYQASTRTLLPR